MKERRRGKNLTAFIAAVLLFLFLDPYFMWGLYKTTPLYAFLGVLLMALFLPQADIKSKKRGSLFVLYTILLLLSTLYGDLNFFGFLGTLCMLFVPFAKEEFARKTFDYFLTIYSVIIGVSAVVWGLSLAGIIQPIGRIEALNELKSYNYDVYPLLVRANNFELLVRFCGPFDEPGVVGTISALILAIGKFNLKDKRLLIVFISGILSMSLYYYGTVAVYYIIYTLTVSRDWKAGVFIAMLVAAFVILSFNNEEFYDLFLARLEWNEETGSIAGDNRLQDGSMSLLKRYAGTSAIFFGIGKTDEFLRATDGEMSLFVTIIQYGLFFVLTYIYVFVAYGWRYKRGLVTYLLFLFVLLGCLYQRPSLFQPEYLFLFSLLAMSCGDLVRSNKTERTIKNNNQR